MKRFLMYIVVAIVLISMGFSVYYVVRNDEEIYCEIEGDDLFYINKNETLSIPIVRENPASYTEIYLKSGYEEYLDVDLENWTITGKSAGIATLTFASTNKNYEGETFEIHCHIGNGTVNYPYYIRNEQDILNIGKGQYTFASSYEVVDDITMTAPIMPIGVKIEDGVMTVKEFSGTITGGVERHKISNAVIKFSSGKYSKSSGFFAVVGPDAKVEDLVFENITVEGYHAYAGTIAGTNFGLIGKCEVVNGTVTNTYSKGYTGGIVGLNKHMEGSDNYAQVNICSANVELNANWVAGGAVGKNSGGVIYNCLLKTDKLNLSVGGDIDAKYSYFGGVAGISLCGEDNGEIYDSYVANCLAYINNIQPTTSHVAGIFGAYYGKSKAYEAEGNYKMLMYVAPSTVKAYYLCDDEIEISDKNPNTASNYAKLLTNEEALIKKTYTAPLGSNWDFKAVWSLMPNESIKIAFDSEDEENPLTYQTFASNGQTISISTKKEFEAALSTMRAQPNKKYIYEFTESIAYDCKGNTWVPIGSKTRPFKGQFKMADGITLTIKNVKIDAEYAGLFGTISGNNTIVKNIILQDAEINGTMVGGIAAYNDGAIIENCQVIGDTNFYTNKYLGTIAGYNTGTIKDCLICSVIKTEEIDIGNGETSEEIVIDEETGEPIYTMASVSGGIYINKDTTESVFYLGGITGKNAGTISNVFLSKLEILQLAGEGRTLFLGGATGMNQGVISDVIVNNGVSVDAEDYNTSSAWIGGLVGYHYKGKIESCAVTGEEGKVISSFAFCVANENVVAGGLAGYIAKESEILYSVADRISIQAYSVGGFAGVCDGKIVQSYVSTNCLMEGAYVGGFAGSLKGTIQDCMTAAEFHASKVQAGMTVYLRKGSVIDHCYIDVLFKQSADDPKDKVVYAETSSAFRARPDQFGVITNTIIVADTKIVATKDSNGNEITHEEIDYFTLYSPLLNNNFRYLTGLKIKINGVAADLQVKFHVFEFSENGALVSEYTALSCVSDGLLSKNGFLTSNWNLAADDVNAQEMALPLKAAEVVKVDIAARHRSSSSGGAGTNSGNTENGSEGAGETDTSTPSENESSNLDEAAQETAIVPSKVKFAA